MKFVSALSEADTVAADTVAADTVAADTVALEQQGCGGKTHRVRQRAHAVLLSARGYPLEQLADILGADRDTVSDCTQAYKGWLDNWQARGLEGLKD